jgi:hypothetical protein
MIGLGDLLVFFAVVGISLAYLFVLHHFLGKSENPENPNGLSADKPPGKKSPDPRDHT